MTTPRWIPLILISSVATLALPWTSNAQCPRVGDVSALAEGEIGLFLDPTGLNACVDGPPLNTPFDAYLVVRVPEGGIAEFEIPELLPASEDGALVVLGSSLPDESAYELLVYNDECSRGHRPEETVCPVEQGDILAIARVTLMLVAHVDASVCFQTGCHELAGPKAGPPQYWRCDNGQMGTFGGWDELCLHIEGSSPTTPVRETTWGAIKALYR